MNNKKSIIALLLVAIIGIVGLTIAYFSSEATITNEFQSSEYGTTIEEVFTSPDNWTPGTTTPKTLTVTNTGNVGEAVRISYTETWTSANAQEEGDLALSQNGNSAAIINWANVSDWTTVTENGTTYKYYKYQLAPNETTSDLLSSVTFNSAITNDEDCVTSNNGQTITCTSTGDGYDGATYKLTFHIETVQYDKYNEAWNLNNSVTILEQRPQPTAAEYLVINFTNPANTGYNDTGADEGEMFVFTHGEGVNQVTDYRYIGANPNNYVYFNCDAQQEGVEYNYATSCEVWRILGVFDVDDGNGNVEQRIKLVRGSSFASTMAFDSNNYNDWTASTLKTFLNGDYYNASGDAATYGLKASAKNMIGDAVYYLGGRAFDSTTYYGSTEEVYLWERDNVVYDNTRSTEWVGKVALMYISDEYMTYKGVDTTCYENPFNCKTSKGGTPTLSWLFNTNILEGESTVNATWLLSPRSDGSSYIFVASLAGGLGYAFGDSDNFGVRPVVYLKSNIKIIDGTGEAGSPYVLEAIQ